MDFATIIGKLYLGQAITVGGFIMGGAIPCPSKRGAYHDAHNATLAWHAKRRINANACKEGFHDNYWIKGLPLTARTINMGMEYPRA